MSVELKVEFVGLDRLSNMLKAAGTKAPQAIRRAVNHTGDKARTAMVRELAQQTGLKVGTMKRALKTTKARDGGSSGYVAGKGSLEYTIRSRGGDIAARYFHPVEKGAGVNIRPLGKAKFVVGAFKKSGPPGKRRINPLFHGNVLMNAAGGKWGGKMRAVKSGVFIPNEMVTGATAAKFYEIVERDLPARLSHELARIFEGK